MDIGKYELLLKAVELRNLTKAATTLGYTQSGASHIISSIESELGLSLLRRDHSGTHLTTEGELLLPAIREMVSCGEKIQSMAQSILGLQAGVMRVAAFTSISLLWVPQIVGRFHTQYPNIRVEIISGTGSYQEMEEFLLTARVNCGFVRMPVDPALQCVPLLRDPLLLVLPPDHPLAARAAPPGEPLTVLDVSCLRELTFCLIYRQSTQREVIDPLFDAAGCKANLFLETGSNRANISMVRRGLSCSILPAHYVRGVEDVARFRLSAHPTWTVTACSRRGRYLSQAARHFIRLAGEYFQSAGAAPGEKELSQ